MDVSVASDVLMSQSVSSTPKMHLTHIDYDPHYVVKLWAKLKLSSQSQYQLST
jgi:hypothetical protein